MLLPALDTEAGDDDAAGNQPPASFLKDIAATDVATVPGILHP